ncbi:MAG: multidrug efflux protein [Gammaproteobacteria bacterium]|jgi:multidrug efflux pump|nr:multidrug efflux protein [Gammaproteobacteria bacterium]MBT4492774.1 multidrug efflux protein [Gammaproteobacteria bacterium]MBT7370361.1 multidrug efflux protein [Gammaproteobacteria bacterium]
MITDPFVNRPVLATVITLMILLVGLRSMSLLELREYPRADTAVISVTTVYPGADADLVQGFITTPLQRAVSEAEGIDYLIANSNQGISTIQAHMMLNHDPNVAIADIQAKVSSQRSTLPREALDPVIDLRTGDAFSLLYLAFSSEEMNPSQITDYLMRGPIPKIQAVPGVAKAQISGNQTYAMRVWLHPQRMVALGVTAIDIRDALQRNNFQAGVGKTKGDYLSIDLSATTAITEVEAFRDLIIRSDADALVRMRDVAEVSLDAKNFDQTSWYNGTPAIMVGIEAAPGANPLIVSDSVRSLVDDIERQLPESLRLYKVHDGSQYIEDSIDEVLRTLMEALIIVLIIILLSLGSWHAAIVPALSVPLALVGAGFIMLMFGFSLNLLTLLALLLAIGLVVDDAIIVVENVHRHIQQGKTPLDAARDGARELALPIISMTTTLLAVYLPIAFMGGLVGILFTEFAFSLAGAVLISGIIAIVFSPMLSSKVLNTSDEPERFEMFVEGIFENIAAGYRKILARTLSALPVTVMFAVAIMASIYFMFISSTNELAPTEDREVVNVQIKAPETATLEYVKAYMLQVEDIVNNIPEHIRHFFLIGGGGTPALSFGGVRFQPVADRVKGQRQLQSELQALFGDVAGLQIAVFSFPPLPGAAGGAPLQFVITSDQDFKQLDAVASDMISSAKASGKFMFLDKSMDMLLPRTQITIDRDRAGDLGVEMNEIGTTLAIMLGDNYVNRFSLEGRSYEVIPQVERDFRHFHEQLDDYYVRAASGDLVPLSGLVSYATTIEPTKRTQFQQLNSVTISGIMAPGVTLGEAIAFMEDQAAVLMPREFAYDYIGESRQFKQQGSALVLTFFLSLLVIYLVLAAQFESWRDPLIILISVPMSIAGALIFVTLGFASLNLYTQVGMITLIGLIAKNGILIVDFANRLQDNEQFSKYDAVLEAATVRLRPILMTTLAMIVAMVPLLIASGPGAESRFQIGLVIATGLGIGTAFTLFVVPAFYLMLAKDRTA